MNRLIEKFYFPKTSATDSNRNYYLDNLKFLLIVLVVVGHFGLWLPNVKEVKGLVYFIYVFHMPCFVFVSGYLAKNMNAGGQLRVDKIFSILWMYFIFKLGNVFLSLIFSNRVPLNLLKDSSAPWYLLALSVWYLTIPFLERIKTKYLIIGSILLGLLIGSVDYIGDVLALHRVLVFFPFFIIGFKLSKEGLSKFLANRFRLVVLILFLLTLCCFLLYWDQLTSVYRIIYGGSPYSSILGTLAPYGIIIRGIWYLVATLLSMAVMLLVPRRKVFFTKLGVRTMQVYILHIWIRSILSYIGFFSAIKKGPTYLFILVLLGSVFLTFLLSNKLFLIIFDKIVPTRFFKKLLNNK